MSNPYFYERNDYLLEHSTNKTFGEILRMSNEEFQKWFRELRETVVYAWDQLGLPPRVGWNEDAIRDQFAKMDAFPVHEFLTTDLYTGEENVIRNTSVIGNAANQWFPTMMKTRITYGSDPSTARSIYDHFKRESLFFKTLKYARRHFRRDSFYHYSFPLKETDSSLSAKKWIETFEKTGAVDAFNKKTHDYWLYQKDIDGEYTGYNNKSDAVNATVFGGKNVEERSLRKVKFLLLTKDEVQDLLDRKLLRKECICNIKIPLEHDHYWIRWYEKKSKLFPVGFKAFRVSWCQYAVNFPPLTAKYLYERYTEHIKGQGQINIWDPSMGWGGRILGAMAVKDDRYIHYIGSDPNTDHWQLEVSKYEHLADFYNEVRNSSTLWPHENTYELHRCGSEEMAGRFTCKLDLVFTSPPYFAKEVYSEDAEQSCHKFGSSYEAWRDGFLRPTLQTAVAQLKSDRYLLWNIADAKFGNEMLPLEQDSNRILEEAGMEYVETLKMSLAQMPGANRLDKEGKGKAKNTCRVKSKDAEIVLKYEPISVWRKP